jgi:phospholipase/lecithinase/hemolysin
MLVGLIPLDLIPMYYGKPADTKQAFNDLVKYYNSALKEMLEGFMVDKSNIDTSFFDTYQLFETLYSQNELQRNARVNCGGKTNCGE